MRWPNVLDDGFPVLGTCAGLVLLAREVLDGRPDQRSFGALDAVVRRNGFGRQVASFETELEFGEGPPLPAVFIRAPYRGQCRRRRSTCWPRCGIGATGLRCPPWRHRRLVRQGNVLASCFHPELTGDRRVHRLFAEMCAGG